MRCRCRGDPDTASAEAWRRCYRLRARRAVAQPGENLFRLLAVRTREVDPEHLSLHQALAESVLALEIVERARHRRAGDHRQRLDRERVEAGLLEFLRAPGDEGRIGAA